MRIRTRLIPVAVAVVVSATVYAIHLTSAPPNHTVHAPYSTAEALEFQLFSTGRVVADHPDLAKQPTLATAGPALTAAITVETPPAHSAASS